MKRNLTITGITVLLIHFTFVLIFCFASDFKNTATVDIAGRYVVPVFNQNWKMFAPEPPMCENRIYYRCRFCDSSYSAWMDPSKKILHKHQATLFWNYGKLFNISESIYRELKYSDSFIREELEKENNKDKSEYDKRVKDSQQYKMAIRYLKAESVKEFRNKKISQLDFMFVSTCLPELKNKNANQTFELTIFPSAKLEHENQ